MFLSLVPDFRFIRSLNLHAGAFLESLVTFVRAGVGKFGHSKRFKKEIPWNGEAALHPHVQKTPDIREMVCTFLLIGD